MRDGGRGGCGGRCRNRATCVGVWAAGVLPVGSWATGVLTAAHHQECANASPARGVHSRSHKVSSQVSAHAHLHGTGAQMAGVPWCQCAAWARLRGRCARPRSVGGTLPYQSAVCWGVVSVAGTASLLAACRRVSNFWSPASQGRGSGGDPTTHIRPNKSTRCARPSPAVVRRCVLSCCWSAGSGSELGANEVSETAESSTQLLSHPAPKHRARWRRGAQGLLVWSCQQVHCWTGGQVYGYTHTQPTASGQDSTQSTVHSGGEGPAGVLLGLHVRLAEMRAAGLKRADGVDQRRTRE